jgi:uncharacterized RDD family membrane protein YckC
MESNYEDTLDLDTTDYAGFGLRLAAWLIDGILIGVVVGVAMLILGTIGFGAMGGVGGFEDLANNPDEVPPGMIAAMMGAYFGFIGFTMVAAWLYFALMESSYRQATLGKMAVGIKVTNMDGGKISFLNATGRYFGKIISGMIMYVGYIMAAFTEKKQALHDMMASTLVLRK